MNMVDKEKNVEYLCADLARLSSFTEEYWAKRIRQEAMSSVMSIYEIGWKYKLLYLKGELTDAIYNKI